MFRRMGSVLEKSRTNVLGDLHLDIVRNRHFLEIDKRKDIANQIKRLV